MRAKTVAQVVAAEAGGKTRKDRFQAMMDVFSAMFNRAAQTGVPVKDVVSVTSQFNAYNNIMPTGTPSLVGLAQQAIDAVMANGPTHKGTYYARSYATKGLPKGLTKVKSAVDDHQYYVDPQDRPLKTAIGTKTPSVTRAALPDVKSSLPQTVSATPQSRPNTLASVDRTRSYSPTSGWYARNRQYVKPGLTVADFTTKLSPTEEKSFRSWVKENNVPFNIDKKTPQDYDMRGFYQGLMAGDPAAIAGVDPNDKHMHFSDYYKTPYHETFSAQSKFATPDAPTWQGDQLVAKDGTVVFDDAAPHIPSVAVAETPEEIDRLSQAQMAPDQSEFDARFGRPAINVSKPFSPGKYAEAKAPNTLGNISRNNIKAATPGFNMGTIAAQGALRTALAQRPNTLAQAARPTLARSFTPTGPLNSDVYTPAGGYNVAAAPGADVSKSYADPMALAAAREWGTAQNLPSNPAPASYADVQRDYAARQAATKAKTKAGTELAGTAAASIGDTIGGFFDSVRGQTAAAAIGPEVNRTTPKTDRLQRTATVDEVLAGKPVKTTTVKPEAIYDDPRALAYAEDMQLKPVDAVLPGAVTEDVLPETLAQPKRVVQRVRQPLQLTVRAPRQQFTAPSMPGGTLGGIRAQDRFSVGTGLQGITAAQGGPRGATGFSRSNPGVSVTSRGRTLGTITHNARYQTDTFRDANNNVTGVHYSGNNLSHTLGSIFGGSGSSSSSAGRSSGSSSSGRSGSSNGGRSRGAAGGSLGQSQHSL